MQRLHRRAVDLPDGRSKMYAGLAASIAHERAGIAYVREGLRHGVFWRVLREVPRQMPCLLARIDVRETRNNFFAQWRNRYRN